MRLPDDASSRLLCLGIACVLAGCSMGSGVAASAPAPLAVEGPAADYPMVLGEPFTVEGELFTPADTLNYDAVGYTGLDGGAGITASHRTLPLPSYAEITSLETGTTILVRIERRGPLTGRNLVSLSSAAAAQLNASAGTPIRVRRVNPPEAERAELRNGRSVAERLETPKSLVEVLRRKLPATGAALLSARRIGTGASTTAAPDAPLAASSSLAATAAPLPPLPAVSPVPRGAHSTPPAGDGLVVQAGAFASRANADRAAKGVGGFVSPSGRLFLVRTGPFASRGQAEAALAKVRAAGYSDARVYLAD